MQIRGRSFKASSLQVGENFNYLNFPPLKFSSRYRDPQLQVADNYSYLFNLNTNICKSLCLDTHFIANNSDLVDE